MQHALLATRWPRIFILQGHDLVTELHALAYVLLYLACNGKVPWRRTPNVVADKFWAAYNGPGFDEIVACAPSGAHFIPCNLRAACI